MELPAVDPKSVKAVPEAFMLPKIESADPKNVMAGRLLVESDARYVSLVEGDTPGIP